MREPTETPLQLPSRLLELPMFVMVQLLRYGKRMAGHGAPGGRLPQLMVLASLDEFGPQSQKDLSRRLAFDPSDMVAVIDRLEADGHAIRERDPADRRRHAVAITPAGRASLDAWLEQAPERSARLFGGLTDDEQQQLLALLRRALAHIDERVPGSCRAQEEDA